MNPQILRRISVSYFHHYRFETIEAYPFIFLCSEDQGFALFQEKSFRRFGTLLCKYFKCPIIKDVTVLVYFQERRTSVPMTLHQHLLQMFWIPIHTPRNKTGISSHGKGQRIKRMINATHRC